MFKTNNQSSDIILSKLREYQCKFRQWILNEMKKEENFEKKINKVFSKTWIIFSLRGISWTLSGLVAIVC